MTPEWVGDIKTAEDERNLLRDIWSGLDLAVRNSLDYTGRSITRTERQKLTHCAIEEFDLPITYSWYLAGSKTEMSYQGQSNRDSDFDSRHFGAKSHSQKRRVSKFSEYFGSAELFLGYSLRDVWFKPKHEFLIDFYREFSPEEYRDLYIHSTKFRYELEKLGEATQANSEHATLTSFSKDTDSQGVLSTKQENELRYLVSDMHLDISDIEEFDETLELFTRGTDSIEHVLSALTEIESVNEVQQDVILGLQKYFYEWIWKYPCLKVSSLTATGPRAAELAQRRQETYMNFSSQLEIEIRSMDAKASNAELTQSLTSLDYEDSRPTKYLHSLTRDVILE